MSQFIQWVKASERLPTRKRGKSSSKDVIVSDGAMSGVGCYDFRVGCWVYTLIGNETRFAYIACDNKITHWIDKPK
jgi:hypothetical protein